MSMDKRFVEIFTRLDAIEKAIKAQSKPVNTAVTKEQLMSIKGVGSSTADEILKLLNS